MSLIKVTCDRSGVIATFILDRERNRWAIDDIKAQTAYGKLDRRTRLRRGYLPPSPDRGQGGAVTQGRWSRAVEGVGVVVVCRPCNDQELIPSDLFQRYCEMETRRRVSLRDVRAGLAYIRSQ